MNKQPTIQNTALQTGDAEILSSLVINGDLSKLNANQKVDYYRMFCERVGLDPLSQPFLLLKLNGKEKLYCDRSGAAQLNKLHDVSHVIAAREIVSGCYVVTARASTPNGRHTESIGAVTIDNLRGEALCNAYMKAETKAKRRATLDLLGLGILDETETETIPNAQTVEMPTQQQAEKPKPLISAKQFDLLMGRIQSGETAAADNAIAVFSFTDEQRDTLMAALPPDPFKQTP